MTTTFKQISAGHSRSLVLLGDDSAWAWGNVGRIDRASSADDPLAAICGFGPLEIGQNRYSQPLPQWLNPELPIAYLTDTVHGLLALDPQGRAARLAAATSLKTGAAYSVIAGLADPLQQVCGNETARYGIDNSKHLWSWGSNFQGQLGRMSEATLNQPPAKVDGLPQLERIVVGKSHVLALTAKGEVWAWGANAAGQLGQGHLTELTQPTRVRINAKICSIAAGDTHSLALDDNGRLYAWGSNHCGQLGPLKNTLPGWAPKPTRIPLSFKLKQVGAGMHFSVALTDQREVYAWGWNGMSQLGEAAEKMTNQPQAIAGLGDVDKISVGSFHTLALNPNGLYAWGDNRNSACGLSSNRSAVVAKPNRITFA